jgi:putative Holliday junction resolvase
LYRSLCPAGFRFRRGKLRKRSFTLIPSAPPRYLALDVGARRIGVAVSDELGLTALPVLTLDLHRQPRPSPRETLRSIARLCRRFGVAGIVVGLPLHMSGGMSPRAEKVKAFANDLGALTELPIHLWDERLTTHEAHTLLYQAGRARQTHAKVVDQVAATLILQSFLDEHLPASDASASPDPGISQH